MADEQIDIVESSLEKPKKKQVSAKVMENLRKAQARKKELDEEKKKMSSEKKKQLAKERQITRLAKKLDTLKDSLPPTIIERSSSSSQNKIEAPKAPKKAKPPPLLPHPKVAKVAIVTAMLKLLFCERDHLNPRLTKLRKRSQGLLWRSPYLSLGKKSQT